MSATHEIRLTRRALGAAGVPALTATSEPTTPVTAVRYRSDDAAARVAGGASPGVARMSVNAVGAFTFTLIGALVAFSMMPMVVGYQPAVVTSGSMEPSLRRSDVVVLAPRPKGRVPVGTVINFRTPTGDVIHRVVDLTSQGYLTKGDANPTPDSATVAARDITGVGAFLIPFVGVPELWVDSGEWLKLAGVILVLIVAGHVGRKNWLLPSPRGRSRRRIRSGRVRS